MTDARKNRQDGGDLSRLLAVMRTLRSPGGCPWDREQTHESLKRYLLEETYELLDAIDAGNDDAFVDELGDVLLQVVFHATIAAETGRFTMQDVIDGLTDKLVRRHPHVFGDAEASDAAAVSRLWAEVKRQEASPGGTNAPGVASMLDDISRSFPALMEAEKLQRRAARVGFEWDDIDGAWEKVREELNELSSAIKARSSDNADETTQAALEEEFGDVLFALVNVARYARIDPEQSLRAANAKFRRRFRYIEERVAALGKSLADMDSAEMDAFWDEAKQSESDGRR